MNKAKQFGWSFWILSVTIILVCLYINHRAHYTLYRSVPHYNACINNLRQIDGAKEQWAMENKKTADDIPTWYDLVGTDKYIKERPLCPHGGALTIGSMKVKPTCSNPEHIL